MKICFAGLENPIIIERGYVSTLRIANQTLFARICQSLLSAKGEEALEPYTIWSEDNEQISPSSAFIPIANPFNLPLKHRSLEGNLFAKLYDETLIDESLRAKLQSINDQLNSSINSLSMQLNANYAFAIEWDLGRYLKAFDFGIETSETASLLDNLIDFVDLGADMAIDEVLLFVNLKTFLSKNDLEQFFDRVIFHGIRVLLLENQHSQIYNELESKTVVDQHFIEYNVTFQSACPPSTQGRFCSNGFGAVTY